MKKDPKKVKKYFIAFEEDTKGGCIPRAHGYKKDEVLKKAKKIQKKSVNEIHVYKYKKGCMIGCVA